MGVLWKGVLSQPQEHRKEQKKGTIGYISHFPPPSSGASACVPALENRVYERKPSKTTTQSHKTDSNAFKSAQSDFAANLFPHRSEGRLTRDFFLAAKEHTHTHKRKKKGKKTHRSLQQFIVVLASASDNVGSFGDRRLGDDNLRA